MGLAWAVQPCACLIEEVAKLMGASTGGFGHGQSISNDNPGSAGHGPIKSAACPADGGGAATLRQKWRANGTSTAVADWVMGNLSDN